MSDTIADQPQRIAAIVRELDVVRWQRTIRLVLTDLLTGGQDYYDPDDLLLALHRDVVMDCEVLARERPARH